MFSNNGEISDHQMIRLLILDIFTGASLFLPMALGKISGSGGLIALILGLCLTLANGWLVCRSAWLCGNVFIPALDKGLLGQWLRWIYGLRCFTAFVFLMGMFSSVLNETFLYMMPKWVIIGGMILVLIYGSLKGIEVRSRLSELLFYLVLIPIILIGLFSIPEADFSRLLEFKDISFGGVFQGILITWVLMAPMEWILYVAPAEKRGNLFKNYGISLGIGGGLILLIYILCLTVLGVGGMAGERWPTVILMQIIRIPGGFMSRQDGLMLSFWIFAMFLSLSGALAHTAQLWGTGMVKAKPWKMWCVGVLGGGLSFWFGLDMEFMNVYFWWMIVSGVILLVLVPLVICLKKRRRTAFLASLLLIFSLTGCEHYVELENRAFVMALGVDKGENQTYKFTYAFPDLEALTGTGGGVKYAPVSVEGESLSNCREAYNSMSSKHMDYGQIKVIVLGKEMMEDSAAMKKLLEEIKWEQEFGRSILVCGTRGKAEDIIGLDESVSGSIGIYLDELFRNNGKELGIKSIIINDLIQRMDGSDEEIKIPQLFIYEEKPRILR